MFEFKKERKKEKIGKNFNLDFSLENPWVKNVGKRLIKNYNCSVEAFDYKVICEGKKERNKEIKKKIKMNNKKKKDCQEGYHFLTPFYVPGNASNALDIYTYV